MKHLHSSPTVFVKLVNPADKKERQFETWLIKALVDSGASDSILTQEEADKLPVKKTKQEWKWSTASGFLTSNTKTETSFSLPELHANKLINQSLHVVDLNIDRYDMIIGRDLIRSLGIDIHGADMTIHWDNAAIPWRDIDSTTNNVFALSQYNAPFNSETKRMKRILDAKYTKADLKTIAESSTHLDPQERNELYTLLKKYECLFDGNIGTWHGKPYDIKLKPDAGPYHGNNFPITSIHERTFKQELDWLEALRVINKVNRSQWGAPEFIIPKKDSTRSKYGILPYWTKFSV